MAVRRALPLLLVLLLSLPARPALAQADPATPASLDLLADKSGDVQATGPAPAPLGGPQWGALDLVKLNGSESLTDLSFTLTVASLGDDAPARAQASYQVHLRHHDRSYMLRLFFSALPSQAPTGSATLYLEHADGTEDFLQSLPMTANVAAGTLTVAIPREQLVDNEGAAPYPGRVLDSFWVESQVLGSQDINAGAGNASLPDPEDRMPDQGLGTVALPIVLGLVQTGHALLRSEEPFRASNGEATTFVYRVNATNNGTQSDVFDFNATGQPSSWDVKVPDLLRIDAGQTVTVPIIVRTTFAHAHGTVAGFVVEMHSESDAGSVGRVQLGVRYTQPPQPAGHHNRVFFHSTDFSKDPASLVVGTAFDAALGAPPQGVFFNTLDPSEDPADGKVNTKGQFCNLGALSDNDTVFSGYCWTLPLSPTLEMGIDVDLAANGSYLVPLHTLFPMPGARVQGEVVWLAPVDPNSPFGDFGRKQVKVATLQPSGRVDLLANQDQLFQGTITPEAEGDLIPYQRGASLVLNLEARTARPDNIELGPKLEPELAPGGSMILPLREYEDPVDETQGVNALATLAVAGDTHRLENPGKTVLYNMTLRNDSGKDQEFLLDLVGSNRDWGHVLAPATLKVGKGQAGTFAVSVAVPASATDGERADLIVQAASSSDISIRALARLVTTTDTAADHPDDAAAAAALMPHPHKSPGLETPSLLLALVALALLGRRRPS